MSYDLYMVPFDCHDNLSVFLSHFGLALTNLNCPIEVHLTFRNLLMSRHATV